MSGHSKWHNIKRKKEAEDTKKSKVFSKMSRVIMVAAKEGGGDPSKNHGLRFAIERAKSARMPKENIERAVKKGLGVSEGLDFDDVIYEGYGPGGVAFMVEVLTDSRNRTVSEVRLIFEKFGGSLGGMGSTSYIFGEDPENPSFTVPISSNSTIEKVKKLVIALEGNEDVQHVYANYESPEEVEKLV